MTDKITRIAIVDSNRCKPKRCAQECKKVRHSILVLESFGADQVLQSCPVVKMGVLNVSYDI